MNNKNNYLRTAVENKEISEEECIKGEMLLSLFNEGLKTVSHKTKQLITEIAGDM